MSCPKPSNLLSTEGPKTAAPVRLTLVVAMPTSSLSNLTSIYGPWYIRPTSDMAFPPREVQRPTHSEHQVSGFKTHRPPISAFLTGLLPFVSEGQALITALVEIGLTPLGEGVPDTFVTDMLLGSSAISRKVESTTPVSLARIRLYIPAVADTRVRVAISNVPP